MTGKRPSICYVVTIATTIRAFFIPQLKRLAENYDVSVVCSPDDSLQAQLGDSIEYIPLEIPRGISLFGTFRVIAQLKSIFDAKKFDLVQYSTPNAGFCSAVAAWMSGVKIRNYHLMGFRFLGIEGPLRPVIKALDVIACRLSTSVECVSRSNLTLGVEEGVFDPAKATVVWNGSTGGVDLKRFDASRREDYRRAVRSELGIPLDAFVFGFAGRITPDKGVCELLKAFSELSGCYLLLVGKVEEDFEGNEQFAAAIRQGNVLHHDTVSDIERYYPAFDVLVLPSYREGFGNVVIEAAAMGTPAIVSNIPGPVDAVLPGETALLCEPKDTTALLVCMSKILDSDVAESMGNAAKEYVAAHFDSKILVEKIVDRKSYLLETVSR